MIRKIMALLCALNLGSNLLAQPPESVLENPASSANGRQFWNLVLPPAPGPVARQARIPVRLILSAHGSSQDAEWCLNIIRDSLRNVPADRPVYIWLEHAYPAGIPDTIRGLQLKIAGSADALNWQREFAEWPLPHETEMALREPFEKARRKESLFPDEMAFRDGDFMKKIYRDLTGFRGNRNLGLRREEPSFGAYLEDLRRDAMGLVTEYWLEKNRRDLALASLALAYRHLKRSLWIRDRKLAESIAEIQAKNPGSVHFILRGLAHIETLGQALSLAGIGHEDSMPADERSHIEGYLIRHGSLPSADTVTGVRFLNEELSRSR